MKLPDLFERFMKESPFSLFFVFPEKAGIQANELLLSRE
jgi:hypothetical protein